jgi:hypothetical protein
MNKFTILLLLYSCMMQSQDRSLVWSEEFDSETIDTTTWNFEKGFGHNNEEQCYTSRENNIRIENGDLVIEERKSTNRQVSPQQG